MHDPLTMAFRIQLPRLRPKKYSWTKKRDWTWTLATVWHRDPSGYDDITCKYSDHMKHPQHWRLQFDLWQKIRRRYLDRCAWCKGPSRKGDSVNISHQWEAPKRPWWGHRDCFHQDCSAIHEAHSACICEDGIYDRELSGWAYGTCAKCGKRREWRSDTNRDSPTDATRKILASIPQGQRDAAKFEQVRDMWKQHRQQEEASA